MTRGEFAYLVFGRRLNRIQAGHALPAMIRDKVELNLKMKAAGYEPNKKDYTPRQLKIMSDFIKRYPYVVDDYVVKFENFSKKKN